MLISNYKRLWPASAMFQVKSEMQSHTIILSSISLTTLHNYLQIRTSLGGKQLSAFTRCDILVTKEVTEEMVLPSTMHFIACLTPPCKFQQNA